MNYIDLVMLNSTVIDEINLMFILINILINIFSYLVLAHILFCFIAAIVLSELDL